MLDVHSRNERGRAFYERNGFVVVGGGDTPDCDLTLRRTLDYAPALHAAATTPPTAIEWRRAPAQSEHGQDPDQGPEGEDGEGDASTHRGRRDPGGRRRRS